MRARKPGRNKPCLQCGAIFWCVGSRDVGGQFAEKKFCKAACAFAHKRAQGPQNFWAKVDKNGAGGCWLYMGFRKWDGYGWVARSEGNNKPRWMTAHRYAWILTNGQPPEGMHLLHTCDNPPCCNPAHLQLGTHLENMADMRAKGRTSKGKRKYGHQVLHPDRIRPVRKETA